MTVDIMAAPADMSMKVFDGSWVLNRSLSDDLDPALSLQSMPWLFRKAVRWATITIHIKTSAEADVPIITIDQSATGGIKGETEIRKLDWSEITHTSGVFGTTTHRSRWTGVKGETESGNGGPLDPYLTQGWSEEESAQFVQDFAVNEKGGWTVEQLWGFVVVDGERYHARKMFLKKGNEVVKVRILYESKGQPNST